MNFPRLVGLAFVAVLSLSFANVAEAQSSAAVVDLSLSNSADSATPYEGGTVKYTIVLSNDGANSATNIQVDHLLPDGVSYVSASPTQGYYVGETGIWALASLPAGEKATLSVVGRIDKGTRGSTLVDAARIAGFDQRDRNPNNDSVRTDVRVRQANRDEVVALEEAAGLGAAMAGNADLGIAKTVDVASPAESGTINYTVILSNGGPDPATGFVIS